MPFRVDKAYDAAYHYAMSKKSAAAERQRVRDILSRCLAKLELDDRRVVLEDALYEFVELASKKPTVRRKEIAEAVQRLPQALHEIARPALENFGHGELLDAASIPLWRRIELYCQEHPTANGKYDPSLLAAALLPNDPAGKGRTMIYVTVKRKSPQSDRVCKNPRFEVLENSHFRLLGSQRREDQMA